MEGQKQPSNQKRILLGNPKLVTRLLDTYQATRALMNHRNMPQQDTNLSPLFGRPLIETICPITIDNKYRQEWVRIADKKEEALAKHRIFTNTTDRELKPLETGDSVQIQNKTGNHRNRWYSTGTISEALPNRQYQVIVGSLRVTLRIEGFYEKLTQYAERYRNHLYCHTKISMQKGTTTTSTVTHPTFWATSTRRNPYFYRPQPVSGHQPRLLKRQENSPLQHRGEANESESWEDLCPQNWPDSRMIKGDMYSRH